MFAHAVLSKQSVKVGKVAEKTDLSCSMRSEKKASKASRSHDEFGGMLAKSTHIMCTGVVK